MGVAVGQGSSGEEHDEHGATCLMRLHAEGYTRLVELVGGYAEWSKVFTPAGIRRQHGRYTTPGSEVCARALDRCSQRTHAPGPIDPHPSSPGGADITSQRTRSK